jgi:integrase/recombinase XerC
MRISELANLDKTDLKLDVEGKKILDDKLFIMGKGKKQRYVYLTGRAILNLERYLQVRDDDLPALFLPYKGTRRKDVDIGMVRLSSRYIQDMIAKYKKRLGIQVPTTPHSLRHGFATYLAEQGANPAAIQRLLGHESLQTTTRYVHASDKYAEKSHKEYHPLKN